MPRNYFSSRLTYYYSCYTLGFIALTGILAYLEKQGLPSHWVGYTYLAFTMILYATIGILSRTTDVAEYYVAGRRVPAIFNGMAISADWMSAASFIGLAGTLYISGHQGLAYVMGWTGGFVLVALLLAPYLRRFGQYTIPDFLGERYGGQLIRILSAAATILASFVYVVAQIYGVGLITSRLIGLQFEVGIFIGLTGILVCSFLGGMRAITWTQVAQYIVLIIAYLLPVSILSYQITGLPVPQIAYNQVLPDIESFENSLLTNKAEMQVRQLYQLRADQLSEKISALPGSLQKERDALAAELNQKKTEGAPLPDILNIERTRAQLPENVTEARIKWQRAMEQDRKKSMGPISHTEPFADTQTDKNHKQANFLALVFCLMIGTASLPHILTRYYTTSTVKETRHSVGWSVFFILLLYLTAESYATFAKYEIYQHVVGSNIANIPDWIRTWGKSGLISIEDINFDGILQLAEIEINPDVIVLAIPEIAGMPYVITGLVAAGALAAALSTADGLLLSISSAISHDIYHRLLRPNSSTQWRLVIAKFTLLVMAAFAALVASQKPATILYMVAWAFSIAASAFFPALVLGIFWKRANRQGAITGIVLGLGITLYYMLRVEADQLLWLHHLLPKLKMDLWFGIESIAAGVFGVSIGFVTIILVSLCTKKPSKSMQTFVEKIRYPSTTHND